MLLHTKGANEGAAEPVARRVMTLRNRVGLHSRPAGAFVRVAKEFQSRIKVSLGAKEADGKSILSVLSLEAGQGAFIEVEATGLDAAEAIRALHALVMGKFGEPE
jgi:phosphocarrier protein HPr